jgi:NAD-dependent deacetylase
MLDQVVKAIQKSSSAAVLTGAGISAESGVPTFRGQQGLWKKFRPEQLATMEAFLADPAVVWEWYNWRRQLIAETKPNPGHYALKDMAELFEDFTLITQNVDNLHRLAGSTRILELHGNIYRNKCADCGRPMTGEFEIVPDTLPSCPVCRGRIRPDVVWFGEMLPEDVIEEAYLVSERVDVFFSVGTSALVHPAASLPLIAKRRGAILIEINPERTPLSDYADFSFQANSGEILPDLVNRLRAVSDRGGRG